MRSTLRRWSPMLAAMLLASALVGARISAPGPFESLRLGGFDTMQRLWPRADPQTAPVQVVVIDEDSLDRLGQWPWSRDVIAGLLRALQDLGAKAIGFDMVFAEADRTSPARLAAMFPGAQISGLADYDAELAGALARGRAVLGFGLRAGAGGRMPDIKAGFATIGADPMVSLRHFAGAVTNLPALESTADGLGSFTVIPGRDQVVRRLPLLQTVCDQITPSLSLETLRVASKVDTITIRARTAGGRADPVIGYTLRLGTLEIPVDADGAIWLHHAPSQPDAAIAAWQLLDPNQRAALRERIAGRIVFVGASAVGLVDLRATPLNPFEPGVNINAGAVAQILSGRFLNRPFWAGPGELALAVALAIALGLLASVGRLRATAYGAATAALSLLITAQQGFQAGLLLDATCPMVALLLTFPSVSLVRYLTAERGARHLRAAFSQYLSPQLVDHLMRDPGRLRLGGEVREMTFLFTDLEGFTTLTESQGAEALVDLLNRYLDGLCSIAVAHGGTLDKIVGDALHVMFNAPVDQADHALRAVRCALAMDEFACGFAAEQQQVGLVFGKTRIGVNTGRAVVGNFGGSRRFDYTAHGDAINTAARLEAANKTLGTRICVARSTIERIESNAITFRPAGTLLLKGKTSGVEVFEPMTASDAANGWFAAYDEAFSRFSHGDVRGAEMLLALHAQYPQDPLLALYAQRIAEGFGVSPLAA